MKQCENCHAIWPGNPKFCGGCGRSFDGRICQHGHRNPPEATHCLDCGSDDLSTPARSQSVGCLGKGLLLLILVALAFLARGWFVFLAIIAVRLFLLTVMPFLFAWIVFERGKVPSTSMRVYGYLFGLFGRFCGAILHYLVPEFFPAMEPLKTTSREVRRQ